jgi:hypothetical protein
MSNLNPSSIASPRSHKFLNQHPRLFDLLLNNCDCDLHEVAVAIEPILLAPKRCQLAPFYIQAIATERSLFLATNLAQRQTIKIVPTASNWLIGRSPNCAILAPNNTVSRRHAMIAYDPDGQFYITDVGSSNGTWVNCRRLKSTERRLVQDGDMIQLGMLQCEFFVSTSAQQSLRPVEPSQQVDTPS